MFSRAFAPFACCALLAAWPAAAQLNVGRISGAVTDSSGAAIPTAVITITNQATQHKSKVTADSNGFYLVPNLTVGSYDVEAEAPGFRAARKTGFDLADDGRITADFVLQVGTVNSTIEVTAVAGETVNTVSGEVSRVIDSEQVQDLALNGRNYMQLVSLVPGVALTSLDQMALTTSLSVGNQSVNGGRTDSNHLMVDGGMNLDSGSNTSQINNVGVDFIQEVKVQTSGFSAQFGRNSGASINVVTKSGGDHYHGSLFETIRNDYLDARDYFAPVKPKLRFNDFGWSLGGPIKKQKLFFFAGEEWKRIRRFTNPSRQTMPTLAEIGGNFSDRTSTSIFFPGTKTAIPNKDLSGLMTPDGKAIMGVYAAMIKYAAAYINTPTSNNATFQVLNPFNFREDIARIDWRPTDNHAIYIRYIHDNYNTIDPFGSFTASALPTTPTLRDRPGYGPQFGYVWTINPHLLNEAKINSSWNGQRTPLQGDNWKRSTYGFQFPHQLAGAGPYPTGIPDITVNSFASFNGPARVYLSSPTTDITISDKITWVHDSHQINIGFSYIRNRKDQNARTAYDGSVAFNTSGNANTTGYALADAALGQFVTYTEAGSDPVGFFRFTQIEGYAEDVWRASRKLSVTVGARYSYFVPTYTVANNVVNFVPALYNPAKAVTVTPAGIIVAGSGDLYNGLIRAGNGVPPDQVGRVPGATSPAVLAVPAGGPRGFFQPSNLLMPRVSFAWSPFTTKRKIVIRSGFGTFHDRTQGNLVFSQTGYPPFGSQVVYQSGSLSNPSGGAVGQPTPFSVRGIDPDLKVPAVYNYNFGIQTELPQGLFLDVGYLGNQGRHLLRGPNINTPPFSALVANNALPSAGRPVTNSIVPYPGYATITEFLSDANSNYNALQSYLTRRKGNLFFTVSYTWSKSLSNANNYNDAGDSIEYVAQHFNYGPTGIDRRHIFVATYTYRIPLLRGRHGIMGAAFSGWEVSGITRYQAGAPLTPTGSSTGVTRRSSYLGGPASLPSDQRGPDHWFNTAAFATAPVDQIGNAGVGIIRGPGWENWDVSLRKVFRIRERLSMRFAAESFNTFNHVNFNDPNVTTSSSSFGTISGSQPARNIQFGLHLAF